MSSYRYARERAAGSRQTFLAVLAAGMACLALAVSSCQLDAPAPGELGQNRKTLATCDRSIKPASDLQIDGTGSSASSAIFNERMAAVEDVVRRTAICSGRLRVSVFAGSSAGVVTLFDGPLSLYGATDNARLRRVPKVVEQAMAEIKDQYPSAVKSFKGGGSDITAEYRLSQEWVGQLGSGFRLHLYLLTDGFQNVGFKISGPLSQAKARALAERTDLPQLPGAAVTVAGLGRVAGPPPSSAVVEGLTFYYNALCRRTGAAKCESVTSYTEAGK